MITEEQARRDGHSADWGAESRLELIDFLYELRRRWWIILAAGLLAAGAAWYATSDEAPAYTTEVLIRRTSSASSLAELGIQRPGMGRETPPDFGSQVEIIRSRRVLEPVVDSLGLQLSFRDRPALRSQLVSEVDVEPQPSGSRYELSFERGEFVARHVRSEEVVARAEPGGWLEGTGFRLRLASSATPIRQPIRFSVRDRTAAVRRLRGSVRVEPGKGRDLIRLRLTHSDPVLAARIVNAVARSFSDFRANSAREAHAQSREFLADQLLQLADSLRDAQDKLLEYQQQHRLLNPEARESSLTEALRQEEINLRQLRSEQSQLESFVMMLGSDSTSAGNVDRIMAMGQKLLPEGQELYSRLAGLKSQRSRLTASQFGYTSENPEVQVVDSLIAENQRQIRLLASESLDFVQRQRSEAEQRVDELRGEVGTVPQRSAQFGRLRQRVDAVQNMYDMLVEKYYEAQIAEAAETGDIEIVDLAQVPRFPDPQYRDRKLAIAFVAGLFLGIGGVGVRRYFDQTIQSTQDAEDATGLSTLGFIPKLDGKDDVAGREAFRSLVANLSASRRDEPRALAVTSAGPKEGKSTVAANLALELRAQEAEVVLIDTDMRRPTVHRSFEAERSPGLSEVLTGAADFTGAVQRPGSFGIDVLSCGSPVDNPPALLSGSRMEELLQSLRQQYRFIVLDTAPVLAVADPIHVCRLADGVIVSAWPNRSERRGLSQAVQQLRSVDGTLLGLVLNHVPAGGGYARSNYGYYQYSSYYQAEAPDLESRERTRPRRLVTRSD